MAVEATNHHLPDLVVHQILQLLPTKSAVRMSFLSKQWEGMWSLSPVLDFDEGDHDNNINREDKMSIRHTLTRYLKLNEKKSENKPALDKFKLRFTRYSSKDAGLVTKLLSFLCSRGVKELDISLGSFSALQADSRWNAKMRYYRKMMHKRDYDKAECSSLSTSARNARDKSRVRNYYYLPPMTFHNPNAKYITSLNLGYVRLKRFNSNGQYAPMSSLKSMSLNMVHFDRESLPDLITRCPFVEHLSFTSCSFEQQQEYIIIQGSTLKSLQVEHCEAHCIEVEQAVNLESLVMISDKICWLILKKCFNLRHVNISASDLEYIELYEGGHHNDVKGTIEAPILHMFEPRYLMSKLSVRAPNLTNMPARNEYRLYEGVIG